MRRIERVDMDFDLLRHESARLLTYEQRWPSTAPVQPVQLARQGFFFTGSLDRVQCAFCRGYLRNWMDGDIPAEEHRKHYPDCPFVRGLGAANTPDTTEELLASVSVLSIDII